MVTDMRSQHSQSILQFRAGTALGASIATSVVLSVAVSGVLSGCGVEGLLSNTDGDFDMPVVRLSGTVAFDLRPPAPDETDPGDEPPPPILVFTDSSGESVEPVSDDVFAEAYELELPVAIYQSGKLTATRNQVRLARYFGEIGDQFDTFELSTANLDIDSTAVAMILDTYLAAFETNLQAVSGQNIDAAISRIERAFGEDTPARRVRDRIREFYALADPEQVRTIFAEPDFTTELRPDPANPGGVIRVPVANASTINVVWLQRNGPDGIDVATTTTTFNLDLAQASVDSQLEGCRDPDNIKVVFEVNFNSGQLDANCSTIVRDKWLRGVSDPGKQMFFVGGVHEESIEPTDSTLRAELNASLGNRGSWTPNSVPMFDDGTNGDATAGDNIWTVTFTMPKGTRVGYKFTWGFQGDSWTGTEEWPGNQRILEATDVNGDDFVRRRDAFGDETTNKDRSNLLAGGGTVNFDTDANDDGFIDARELPFDDNADCRLDIDDGDAFVTPSSVAPATVECEGM